MKKTRAAAAMAVVFVGAAVVSGGAHAQTILGWQGQRQELDPAKRVPVATPQVPQSAPVDAYPQPAVQPVADTPAPVADAPYAIEQPVATHDERGRGGFFLGVQGGKGRVYEHVDQSALAINGGYRWQAGPVALIGVELAGGRLDSAKDDGQRYGKVEYGSLGANARFNFGRDNPLYGLVRAGYWTAEDGTSSMNVDGGYFGLGLGFDVSRQFNVNLVYTNYVYFNDYDWEGDDFYYDINRADTLMFGVEVRF